MLDSGENYELFYIFFWHLKIMLIIPSCVTYIYEYESWGIQIKNSLN